MDLRETDETGRALEWLAGQNHALELIAGGAPLAAVLEHLVGFIEAQAPGLVASVLLLRDGRLYHGAGPRLAGEYIAAIDGLAIGPHVGSCGVAAHYGRPVVTPDIAADPNWAPPFRDIALRHGLRACWSTPILAAGGEVLGTFALYYDTPGGPRTADLRLVTVATHIAGVAIAHHRNEEALRQRTRELLDVDRRKDEFLAVLGHELRNPLTPILHALARMREHGADGEIERCRRIIERQARQLCTLVDDLLDVARVSHGKIALDFAPITAAELVDRALEAAAPALEARGHHLAVELPPDPITLVVDPVRIAQVLANLLGNAAKFTPPGGHIALRARVEADQLLITCTDDGAGIPTDMLPRIFDLFTQVDSPPGRGQGGLGIGLTLARRLVEMHGGRLAARSEGPGKGSEFIVRLPLPAGPLPPAAPTLAPPPPAAPRRVLVVDDNADAADLLALLLADAGHAVQVARDGHDALAAVAAWRPDVVFLDLGLPDIDGFEVARRIRAAHDPGPRLVALTGYGRDADRTRGAEAGIDAHLVKPVDTAALLAALAPA